MSALSTFLWIMSKIWSMSVCLGKNLCTKFPLSVRSSSSFGFWKNDLSSLWNVSDMMPSWNGEFSSKSTLILGLFLLLFVFCNVEGLRSGSQCVEHLVRRDYYYYLLICHMCCLYLVCCLFSLFLFWFLSEFLVSISKGWFVGWLMGSGFPLLNPALPWPTCGLSNFPCLDIVCCFSGLKFGSNSFCTPWTSGNLVPPDLAWECVCIRYVSWALVLSIILLHLSKFLLSSKIL